MNKLEYIKEKEAVGKMILNSTGFDGTQNLLELGLNSLQVMRMVNQWRKRGYRVSFAQLMEEPTFDNWWEILEKCDKTTKKEEGLKTNLAAEIYKEPFALTDVQYAYWVGRADGQPLGGIGCHAYLEFDGQGVEPERLNRAWKLVCGHHPMLRACFTSLGEQKIGDCADYAEVVVHDLQEVNDISKRLEAIRTQLSHRRLEVERGEVAALALSLLPQQKTRIHFEVDLLIADVQSMQIILRDLGAAYRGGPLPEKAKNWCFYSYLGENANQRTENQQAESYWKSRLPDLPFGPGLPLSKKPEDIVVTRFTRRVKYFDKNTLKELKAASARHRTTLAMLLLTAYAKVLERFGSTSHFLLNIPLFNRKTEIDGIEDIVSDFTTLLLLEVDEREPKTFLQSLRSIERRLHTDMEYADFSGVQVQREMAKQHPDQRWFAPVVFACNLGDPIVGNEFEESLGKFTYMISQTPQVWLDFQIFESEHGLMLAWDAVEELFPEGFLDSMFEALVFQAKQLKDDTAWVRDVDLMPASQSEERAAAIKQVVPCADCCLHEGFFAQAEKDPGAIAMVDSESGQMISYGKLRAQALSIGAALQWINPDGPVAIILPRSGVQIAAVLGVMAAGGYYLPIGTSQPEERLEKILEKNKVSHIITSSDVQNKKVCLAGRFVHIVEDMLQTSPMACCLPVLPKSLAYIITTSGSTGEPKGVEVTHSSAMNTINDVNQRYGMVKTDSVLAVSALDFDLSVYDIFGILGVGGRIITLPESESRNADYWLEQVMRYEITVWNSVPILLDMLLVAAKNENQLPLKKVMLSGDWIGMHLPNKLKSKAPQSQLFAMGGATEAFIWSNYQLVTLPLPNHWKTIPYGRPLSNQVYRVVDVKGRDCPAWVRGELWIGGEGVAAGYCGEKQLTMESFPVVDGVRWYRTGDLGRFWNDGTIEFLGREDEQTKIRGHRIELGEIEVAILALDTVKNAAVIANGSTMEKHLVAFVVLENACDDDINFVDREENRRRGELFFAAAQGIPQTPKFHKDSLDNERFLEFITWCDIFSFEAMQEILVSLDYSDIKKEYRHLVENALYNWRIADRKELHSPPNRILDVSVRRVESYVKELQQYLPAIFTGACLPAQIFYHDHPQISPIALLEMFPENEFTMQAYVSLVTDGVMQSSGDKTVTVLDLSSRNPQVIERILDALAGRKIRYVYSDDSLFFLEQTKKALGKRENVEYLFLQKNVSQQWRSDHKNAFDMVVGYNSLHRIAAAGGGAQMIAKFLKQGGLAAFSELYIDSYIMQITAGLLETGKSVSNLLQPFTAWAELFEEAGFLVEKGLPKETFCGRFFIAAQYNKSKRKLDSGKMESKLLQKLPAYMVPKTYVELEYLPVTSNGKLDKRTLEQIAAGQQGQMRTMIEKAQNPTQHRLIALWAEVFGRETISLNDHFFEIGGDSLVATRLVAAIREHFSLDIAIGNIFENPTVRDLSAVIDKMGESTGPNIVRRLPALVPDLENRYRPFSLTDVQHAYFMGRSGLYDLGDVATHCYFELECGPLLPHRLNQALDKLIQRHDMMRAVVLSSGKQIILEQVPAYEITVSVVTEDTRKETIQQIREQMSHQVINTGVWPLFEIRAVDTGKRIHIHISFDNIIFDGWSMFHILEEWAQVYHCTCEEKEDFKISFRDYVLLMEDVKKGEAYQRDKDFWLKRLDTLPAGPELPLEQSPGTIEKQTFERRSFVLEKERWDILKKQAQQLKITPSVLLITVFSEVLRRWSKAPQFTINLTQFMRLPVHEQVEKLVGDFTTLTLLEVDNTGCKNLQERAAAIQKQLVLDMNHSYFSGVEVERELARKNRLQSAVFPVVFTSGIGVNALDDERWLGRLSYNISQTPQIWLDHQVTEMKGSLHVSWDSVDELLSKEMMDDMFAAYTQILVQLVEDKKYWQIESPSLVQIPNITMRRKANDTTAPALQETLGSMFFSAAGKFENRTAIVCNGKRISYSELKKAIAAIAHTLQDAGIVKGDIIGICLPKGWEQISCAYAILYLGAVYLPLDCQSPPERLKHIAMQSKMTLCLTTRGEMDISEVVPCLLVEDVEEADELPLVTNHQPDDLAYIIYTSGSTGVPKGVMITHRGAVNTILDLNKRFDVCENDCILAISQMYFDLSVYDIFGILAAGGTVVIPNQKKLRDPANWIKLMHDEQVTIWNSVPMFMQMLVEYLQTRGTLPYNSLRLCLLSGDWIPLSLTAQLAMVFPACRNMALGGATEASIWSNIFPIPLKVPEGWKSILYGKPLQNQRFYILNKQMQECPNWVLGMLYIAGDGVAKGYCNDPKRTAQQFLWHEELGELLYQTGDFGRYWPDGNIEFLGRADTQVKINGFRVELGEIEKIIKSSAFVQEAVVVYAKQENEKILAALVCGKIENETNYLPDLKKYISQNLPEYMIPQVFIVADSVPLSVNGKVDRKKIGDLALQSLQKQTSSHTETKPVTVLERELAALWQEVIGSENIGMEDNFFELGGNSLQAIQLVNQLNHVYTPLVGVEHLFENPTVRTLAKVVEKML